MDDLERLSRSCRRLSAVYPSETTREAPSEFLALDDPNAALDTALSFLAWQRTLRTVLTHLETAGADLELLLRNGVQGFVAVSGRAYEAAYPRYSTRTEFDSDLLAADLETGAAVACALHDGGYEVEISRILRLGTILAYRREHRLDENFSPVARLLSYLAAIAQLSDETWTAVSGDQPSVDVARPALDAFADLR